MIHLLIYNIFICRKSAPKFLLDVYKRLSDEANDESNRSKRSSINDNNFITNVDKEAIDESDIIMTFLNKSMYA